MIPVGEALFGKNEPTVKIPCMECRQMFDMPKFIVDSVENWNAEETDAARRVGRPPNPIRASQIAPCPKCVPIVRAERDRVFVRENETTAIYLRDLRAGRYNPDVIRWLREHGHSKTVDAAFAAQGEHNA